MFYLFQGAGYVNYVDVGTRFKFVQLDSIRSTYLKQTCVWENQVEKAMSSYLKLITDSTQNELTGLDDSDIIHSNGIDP